MGTKIYQIEKSLESDNIECQILSSESYLLYGYRICPNNKLYGPYFAQM